ncbi:MAG TPA: cytochrome P460 family protein, partial [Pyrinomonadaceae bacterium]
SSFGVVYANELARQAYSGPSKQAYPVGSIFVREKLARANSEKPQVLTVMIKREKGFNPAGGDWSFLAMDGAATKVKQRKKKGDCLECHQSARDRDFVFELK